MSKKKKKNSQLQHRDKTVKQCLINLAGTRCMCCGRDVGSEITWHHLKPRYAGGQDTLVNASLLCSNCHTHIHKYQWGTEEYMRLTKIILERRLEYTGYLTVFNSFSFN